MQINKVFTLPADKHFKARLIISVAFENSRGERVKRFTIVTYMTPPRCALLPSSACVLPLVGMKSLLSVRREAWSGVRALWASWMTVCDVTLRATRPPPSTTRPPPVHLSSA
ncbi:hypothetical protein E2C01_083697 [Portunus trituberculatus]|uniref:Uncharacterized protein n=1 Tax=Portunus trituberculatus TaxID=210409 RepID=A0A5B7J4B2_PORTR|nr:hypothetical protein [Portunus trituberculatus]